MHSLLVRCRPDCDVFTNQTYVHTDKEIRNQRRWARAPHKAAQPGAAYSERCSPSAQRVRGSGGCTGRARRALPDTIESSIASQPPHGRDRTHGASKHPNEGVRARSPCASYSPSWSWADASPCSDAHSSWPRSPRSLYLPTRSRALGRALCERREAPCPRLIAHKPRTHSSRPCRLSFVPGAPGAVRPCRSRCARSAGTEVSVSTV